MSSKFLEVGHFTNVILLLVDGAEVRWHFLRSDAAVMYMGQGCDVLYNVGLCRVRLPSGQCPEG